MNKVNLSEERMRLKKKYGDEKVLVVKTSLIPKEILGKSCRECGLDEIESLLDNSEFMLRYLVEKNPEYRQLIPYIICGSGDTFYATRRLPKSGEERLVGNIALGVGGHINPIDTSNNINDINTFFRAIEREVKEELVLSSNTTGMLFIYGTINDVSNEVGQDHLGIMCIMDLKSDGDIEVKSNEPDKLEVIDINHNYLSQYYDEFENWSKIVYDNTMILGD